MVSLRKGDYLVTNGKRFLSGRTKLLLYVVTDLKRGQISHFFLSSNLPVNRKGVPEPVQPRLLLLITGVDNPSVGLHQHGRTKVPVHVPPIRGARCGAAGAQDALVQAVLKSATVTKQSETTLVEARFSYQFLPVVRRLQELLIASAQVLLVVPLQPGLDRAVLLVELVHVRHQVLDNVHMRQRVDLGGLVARVDFARRIIITLLIFVSRKASENDNANYLMQARVLTPPMFMAHDPQMPSLQDLRKVTVESCSFLILMSASNTMGPQVFRSTLNSCMLGLSPGLSGSNR